MVTWPMSRHAGRPAEVCRALTGWRRAVSDGPVRVVGPSPMLQLPSSSCAVEELCLDPPDLDGALSPLVLDPSWTRRWTTTWRRGGSEVVSPVRDLGSLPMIGWEPVRRFAWRTGQRHRPGLQYLVSTGRHHGFESLAEQRLLLAMDFASDLVELFAQPFRLRYGVAGGGSRDHVPDFLPVTAGGGVVVDRCPGDRIRAAGRVAFAANGGAAPGSGGRQPVAARGRRIQDHHVGSP